MGRFSLALPQPGSPEAAETDSTTVAKHIVMGLKRMHTPCFAPAVSTATPGPVQVRKFNPLARPLLRPPPDAPLMPGEKLDKGKSARQHLPPGTA